MCSVRAQVYQAERQVERCESAARAASRTVDDAERGVDTARVEVEATRQAGAVAEELRVQRKRPLSEDEWTTLKLEAWSAAWEAAVAARQPKTVKLCRASAGELRTAAQWMENEPGLSWEEALKIAREVHFGAWHFASTSLIP